jgi:hypothetical protein
MAESRKTPARVTRGAISLSNSSHFPATAYSKAVKPVAFPPGRAKVSTYPAPTGSATAAKTIGMMRVACSSGDRAALELARRTVRRKRNQFVCKFAHVVGFAVAPAIVDADVLPDGPTQLLQALAQKLSDHPHVAADRPAQFLQPLCERRDAGQCVWIVRGLAHKDANAPQLRRRLLRARRERPGHR